MGGRVVRVCRDGRIELRERRAFGRLVGAQVVQCAAPEIGVKSLGTASSAFGGERTCTACGRLRVG